MKNIYKILIIMLVFVGINIFSLKAESERFVDMQDKASIRYKTTESRQGLKFTANVHRDAVEGVYGMYLVYGEVEKDDLVALINQAKGSEFFINDKKVIHVPFSSLSSENTFSVIITGIPLKNYADQISVLSYVEVRGIVRYAPDVITKSIAEVAFNSINKGETNQAIYNIVDEMEQKIVFRYNALSEIELDRSFYEYDYLYLKEEFNEDFKNINPLGFNDLETIDDEIFRFFQNARLKEKWGWLLNYFLYLSDNEVLNGQIDNLIAKEPVESLEELIYTLTNFFQQENYRKNERIIDFTNIEYYLELKNYNNKIYINPKNYNIYKVGDEFIIPEVEANIHDEVGYAFSYYYIDEVKYNSGDIYVVSDGDVIFTKNYEYKEYNITFKTEEGDYYSEISVKHNDKMKEPPDYDKEGYVIIYWLDEEDNIVNSKTNIISDLVLTPVFKIAITEINITVDKSKYIVTNITGNIDYILDPKEKKYNYLYLTPMEGYGFAKNIVINVTFNDGTKAKFINQEIEPEFIEYIYDDPGWTGRY